MTLATAMLLSYLPVFVWALIEARDQTKKEKSRS
jgi:hypothetical protein